MRRGIAITGQYHPNADCQHVFAQSARQDVAPMETAGIAPRRAEKTRLARGYFAGGTAGGAGVLG